jgi:outer membrane protein OmpA-like peptidoglycan-associated protein
MRFISNGTGFLAMAAVATGLALPVGLAAQAQNPDPIIVDGAPQTQPAALLKGPELKGVITARSNDRLQITTADGTNTIVTIDAATRIRTSGGLFGGRSKLAANSLLNGLPVTIKTWQGGDGLIANQISFRNGDLKTAMMIRNGTAQQFAEQTAATAALRGRMGDIDKYNIKSTTNVYFDTGKAVLSPAAKAELCAAASQAEATDNALLLVVGYTDSVGSEEYNQTLSEKRAARVINHLQQQCRWAPYRMLTPTGMAESDPLASNDTEEGKAQNRRVSVNILVSKSVDGI